MWFACRIHHFVHTLAAVLVLYPALTHGQVSPSKKHPAALKAVQSADDVEMRMRRRLQSNPHDREAHKQLQKLLHAKYAFRPEVIEYASWLKNNPDDYTAELEMRSTATAALDDPEFAIAQDRFVLAHANRSDDPDSYDSVEERMAFLLLKRNKHDEALRLLKHQTQLHPTEAGAWEDLGDAEVQAGKLPDAIVAYQKSIELDGSQENPHEGLADAYVKLNDYRHAGTELMAAISIYNSQYHGAAAPMGSGLSAEGSPR